MKSESTKMMLRLIVLLTTCTTLALCQTDDSSTVLPNKADKGSNIPQDVLDKVIGTKDNKLSENYDLQQQFSSSKERPELNPVLSALINDDVKRSIDAKRQAEQEPTTFKPILTTAKNLATVRSINEGLVDQSISLDEAGSENNKQTSRIQVKKGPNGVDYEYEYVYYYYDDEEKDAVAPKKQSSSTTTASSAPAERGGDSSRGSSRTRYSTVERGSTTAAPEQNEVVSRGGKGRASIPVVEEVVEERLPLNTRFPPRNNITPAAAVSSVASTEETTKKIAVKRPSLELVDSQSFNRDDKGSKGTRILENEFSKTTTEEKKEVSVATAIKKFDEETTEETIEAQDGTTPLMEKVAFDLYAILANENSNADSTTTDNFDESTTDSTGTDSTSDDEYTTLETTTAVLTTTTTTTTPAPTTTTTTTTTTTEAPLLNGRKSPFGASRNRFRLRSQSTTESPTTSEPIVESHFKQNRFSRPSFKGGNRASKPTDVAPAVEETAAVKEDSKPVAASPIGKGGRTRNRFNLRTTSTTEKNVEDNAIESASSTTARSSVRLRPSFNVRGRGRPTAAAASATLPAEGETVAEHDTDKSDDKNDDKPAPTRPSSRFNIGRPNRLIGRGRSPALNNLKNHAGATAAPTPNEADSASASGEEEPIAKLDDDQKSSAENEGDVQETTPQTGLNKLRSRPRIQINAGSTKAKAPVVPINRKVNPLISRRKIGGTTTTEPIENEEDIESQR